MSTGRLGAGDTAIQPTIFDAKADLLTATAADTPARLAVGSDGETLVADSSTTTGLRWQADFSAGRNKIINGDFAINQRNFTSTTTSGIFIFDRFSSNNIGGTVTYTAQTFTPGSAPVAGYEGKNFLDIATTGQSAAADIARTQQRIESVRTLANQIVTISFWAKAASGTPKVAVEIQQIFGSGGSPSSAVNTYFGQATLSTSWARYSVTATLPSISGKTLGTVGDDSLSVNLYTSAGSNFDSRTGNLGIQTATISFWGIQVEAGSVATPFTTATGTLAGELGAAQRYYQRMTATANGNSFANGFAESTTIAVTHIPYKVTMRTAPTALEQSGTATDYKISHQNTNTTCSAVPVFGNATVFAADVSFTVASGLTAGNGLKAVALTGNAYLAWSAEL